MAIFKGLADYVEPQEKGVCNILLIPVKIAPLSLWKGNNSLNHTFSFLSPSVYIYKNHLLPKTYLFISLKYDVWCATILRESLADVFVLLSHLQAPFKELLVFPNPPTKFISSCLQPRVKLN